MNNNQSRSLIEALTHSNWIEGEWSVSALRQSIVAWEWLNRGYKLDTEHILHVHELLMDGRDLADKYKGEFRDCAVSVGGRLCPNIGKKAIDGAVGMWLEKWNIILKGKSLVDVSKIKWIEEAHIEFEKIHPFVDGNGRIGRMLMNWQALKAGLDPIIIKVEDRFNYYKWFE